MHEEVQELLSDKDAEQRASLARGLAARLDSPDVSVSDRRAAQELALQLAEDAVQMVRQELSTAVRHCRFLSRDVAMKIALDVNEVACPFLEVTEVFTEEEWCEIIGTVSDAGR